MKLLAKVAFGSLASVLLISSIAIITPRAVQAVVATIIRDQDNPARHPFTTSCQSQDGVNIVCQSPAIPAGQQFVIETISISGEGNPAGFAFTPHISTFAAGVFSTYDLNAMFDTGILQPGNSQMQEVVSMRLYADPGSQIQCAGDATRPFFINCHFSGYFVTLP
jgi:hypothetical protein